MPDPLKDTFSPYTEACQAKLQPKANSTRHILTPRREVFRSGMATMELRSIVEALEGSPEFHRLLLETRSSLSNDYHGKAEWAWKKAIMNFFRKSAYYHTLFNGGAPSVSEVFAQYVQAFNKRLIDTCYLIPIEYVDFAGPPMDFGLFQIRRFSKSELDEVLLKKLCDNFYPEAALETDRLEQMWFVVIKEVSPARKIGKRIIPFFF
jgi:hypothetical protein